ncbi:MAG: hypothetical protein P8K77_07690 [Polaribacter sp.]|nr:hypothetical protein [Polaribacter sp.]
MNKMFNQILDFPQMVNQKILNAKLNSAVSNFDSQDGIRCYVKTIYQIAALVVLLAMEFAIISGAMDYFQNSDASALGKVGSVLTFLLLMYSAFPIASVIRSRGDSLGGAHNGMVEFVFKDFVLTNIKIVGEVIAITGLFVAFVSTLSFVFDTSLLNTSGGGEAMLDSVRSLYALPGAAVAELTSMVHLDYISDQLSAFAAYKLDTAQNLGNGWNFGNLGMVANSYINVAIGLAVLYVNVAIYTFLYNIVAALVNFIPRLAVPLSISNK